MCFNQSSCLGTFQIIIWYLPDSELQEISYHALYWLTSLVLWRIVLNSIILIFFRLFYHIISLSLYFRIMKSKIYGKHLWMGISSSQILESCFETLEGVCCSKECCAINFAQICLETIFINVCRVVFCCFFFNFLAILFITALFIFLFKYNQFSDLYFLYFLLFYIY